MRGQSTKTQVHSDRLRALRRSHGYTQDQVATLIGCSRSTISTWETHRGNPRPSFLTKLARLYGVKTSTLLAEQLPTPALRTLRLQAGLLQLDLAIILGVKPSTYSDVEGGRQKIPRRWIPILSKTFQLKGIAKDATNDL
jgi:transcriptional regulator with XRE-family HTH domain